MALNVQRELCNLEKMPLKKLHARYREVYGDATASGNRRFLIKRIIWRLQAIEEGDLHERVRRKALAIANDADLRTTAPPEVVFSPAVDGSGTTGRTVTRAVRFAKDNLPAVGSQLTRMYKGRQVIVTVLADGFEYEGETFRSLSAVAKAITGSHLSGHAFFGLTPKTKKKAG